MKPTDSQKLHRRTFLGAALSLPALLTAGCSRTQREHTYDGSLGANRLPGRTTPPAPDQARTRPPSMTDGGVCRRTESNIEGPFFKRGAPSRRNFAPPGTQGTALSIVGRVLNAACQPIPAARLEFWHADHLGAYDNTGFKFRGTLATDPTGRYQLDTIVPGRYQSGATYRPAHIHVKLAARGYAPITTQLYFPDDPYNDSDPWIHAALIMTVARRAGRANGQFNFVLAKR